MTNAADENQALAIHAIDTWAYNWEDIITLRRELDEARRHIDDLLWEIEELNSKIGQLEQEIDSIKENN